jgi:hypothetical protein
MSGKIFVHIGLPKTATTTLQMDFFPAISRDGITYLGVYQPRYASQEPLYEGTCEAIKSGRQIGELRDELMGRLDSGETLILSEEMIAVSQDTMAFREKLRNLSKLLNGLDYQIILTVREPAAALFSYYVERYDEFYRRNIGFMDAAMQDESMFIFHYKKLINELLDNFEKQRVHVYQFESLIKGELQGLCDLIVPGKYTESDLQFTKHNTKVTGADVVYTNKSSSAGTLLRRKLVSIKRRYPGIFNVIKRGLNPLGLLLDRIPLSEMKVQRPSDVEMKRLKEYLSEETAALSTSFDIHY